MSQDFQVGDLVWAKMKSYPPWPAKIAEPTLNAKAPKNKKAHFVYFFGTQNFAWIVDENINLHSDSILNTLTKKKSGTYQKAIEDLIKYAKNNKEKQTIPKKDKTLAEGKRSPPTKVVKIINSVQKKEVRKVILSKPRKKIARKRSRSIDRDVNGGGAGYKSMKIRRFDDSFNRFSDIASHVSMSEESDLGVQQSDFLLKRKHVIPTKKKLGFIGLGHMGKAIVRNLLKSEHDITVWNRASYKCNDMIAMGAKTAQSVSDLVVYCDITFCCVSDPKAVKSLIFGERGIIKGLEQAEKEGLRNKGYVEMTSLDPETSLEICEAISRKQARYLEAPVCGTSRNANDGTLLVLAAGDYELFRDCETCFHAIGKMAYFINCNVGSGAKMSLVLSALSGTMYGALAEALVLLKRLSLPEKDLLKIFLEGPLRMDNLVEKGEMMIQHDFKTVITPLKHMQKDLEFCLLMGNNVSQQMPILAAVNEVYKRSRLLQYADCDVSAVFRGMRY